MFWLKRFFKYLFCIVIALSLLVAGFGIYLACCQPAFYFPKPTGSYSVGTKLYHWIDTKRKELNTNDPEHPFLELLVKVWYPTDTTIKLPISYAPDLIAHLKRTKPLAALLSGAWRKIYVYEQNDAVLSPDMLTWPVIIFSPGQGGRYDSNAAHCQELASYGYIVVGISHPCDSTIMTFPDGRVKTPHETRKSYLEQSKSFLERRKQTDQEHIEERVADVRFVLDQLETLAHNKESIFYKHFDLKHIGIFGQSMGGATAVSMCRRDSRVKAGVNLDGSLFGYDATVPFDKPFMFLMAGESLALIQGPLNKAKQKAFNIHTSQEDAMLKDRSILGFQKIAAAAPDKYIFVLRGAGHIDFTNNALIIKKAASCFSRPIIRYAFVGRLGYGSIDGARALEITNNYQVNFFDKYFKDKPSELLDGNIQRYAEVERLAQNKH